MNGSLWSECCIQCCVEKGIASIVVLKLLLMCGYAHKIILWQSVVIFSVQCLLKPCTHVWLTKAEPHFSSARNSCCTAGKSNLKHVTDETEMRMSPTDPWALQLSSAEIPELSAGLSCASSYIHVAFSHPSNNIQGSRKSIGSQSSRNYMYLSWCLGRQASYCFIFLPQRHSDGWNLTLSHSKHTSCHIK